MLTRRRPPSTGLFPPPAPEQDVVDPIADERLAKFVTRSHMLSHPQFAERYGEQDGFAASGGSQANAASTRGAAGEAGGAGGARTGDDRFRFVGDDTGTHFGVAKEEQISQALLHKYIAYGRRAA